MVSSPQHAPAAASGIRPYLERAPIAALLLGIGQGFPFSMIAATLTTRLAEAGIEKKAVTAFALTLLIYSLKPIWAPAIDRVRLPVLARLIGQRRAWLVVSVAMVVGSVLWLGATDPHAALGTTVAAALAVAFSGATYDIVSDAMRIEALSPRQLGVGSGMVQYGWRIGAAGAGALVLFVASRAGWSIGYAAATLFAVAPLTAAVLVGAPAAVVPVMRRGLAAVRDAVIGPLADFARREGAALTLLFILIHKIGDTIANLSFRLLFHDLGFTKDEVATYDIGFGLIAYLVGLFVGGIVYTRIGMKRAVLVGLVMMAFSNLSFSLLAAYGHSTIGLAAAIGLENFSASVGDVAIVAYLSALCNLRFTATQFALLSALRAVFGRLVNGTTAGSLIERLGYVDFYMLTASLTLPGILIYLYMMRRGLVDEVTSA